MTMNNQSPLIPQGSLLEQRNKGRARVKIAVFLVLAIHGVGLMALLMQGCKKEPDSSLNSTSAADTNANANTAAPAFVEPTNAPGPTTNVATSPTNPTPVPPVEQPSVTAPVTAAASDYVIVKGDTFSTVAKKFHVSVKALLDANPSVEPTKLKIGQSVHIPAVTSTNTAAASTTSTASGTDTNTGGKSYTVKSGDSLTKIATEFGVTLKALRSANNLKTDKIVVGQKLSIPAKSSAAPANPTGTPATGATGQ